MSWLPNFEFVDEAFEKAEIVARVDALLSPCVVVAGEPVSGSVTRATTEFAKSFETRGCPIRWIVCPNATSFFWSACNGRREWQHIEHVPKLDDKELHQYCRELCISAMVLNDIRVVKDMTSMPRKSRIFVFDPASSITIKELSWWRAKEETCDPSRYRECAITRQFAGKFFSKGPRIYAW
jgi:hypothetical protein